MLTFILYGMWVHRNYMQIFTLRSFSLEWSKAPGFGVTGAIWGSAAVLFAEMAPRRLVVGAMQKQISPRILVGLSQAEDLLL